MHFLFPSPSVDTVFPVSDLHCSFQAARSWVRSHAAPRPPAAALGWAGKEAAPCLRDLLEHGSKPRSSWRFPQPLAEVARARALAGSGAECRFHCHSSGVRSALPAWGSLSRALPAPGRPSRPARVASAPRVHNNRGSAAPAPRWSAPTAPPTVCVQNRNPQDGLPHSPRVVSGGSRGPRLARKTPAFRLRGLRPPPPAEPGPGSNQSAESFLFSL